MCSSCLAACPSQGHYIVLQKIFISIKKPLLKKYHDLKKPLFQKKKIKKILIFESRLISKRIIPQKRIRICFYYYGFLYSHFGVYIYIYMYMSTRHSKNILLYVYVHSPLKKYSFDPLSVIYPRKSLITSMVLKVVSQSWGHSLEGSIRGSLGFLGKF